MRTDTNAAKKEYFKEVKTSTFLLYWGSFLVWGSYMKKDPLRICTLTSMVITIVIVFLISSYPFGISILPRLIPSIPEPLASSEIITPLFILVSSVGMMLFLLKHVLAQKYSWGIKPEFTLIAFSFIFIGFG